MLVYDNADGELIARKIISAKLFPFCARDFHNPLRSNLQVISNFSAREIYEKRNPVTAGLKKTALPLCRKVTLLAQEHLTPAHDVSKRKHFGSVFQIASRWTQKSSRATRLYDVTVGDSLLTHREIIDALESQEAYIVQGSWDESGNSGCSVCRFRRGKFVLRGTPCHLLHGPPHLPAFGFIAGGLIISIFSGCSLSRCA